jgi:hypothetical protein
MPVSGRCHTRTDASLSTLGSSSRTDSFSSELAVSFSSERPAAPWVNSSKRSTSAMLSVRSADSQSCRSGEQGVSKLALRGSGECVGCVVNHRGCGWSETAGREEGLAPELIRV